MPVDHLSFVTLKGRNIETIFDDLAALRIVVFREFPYLYNGSIEYEKSYLKTYSQSERAMFYGIFDGLSLVGATTCIPLTDETVEVKSAFNNFEIPMDQIFYFGESILLSEYRGLGLGHRFFDIREAYASSFGQFKTCSFCAVQRVENHHLRPENYRGNEAFWQKRGYRPEPTLQTTFSWQDLDENEESPKPMQFWTKSIDILQT